LARDAVDALARDKTNAPEADGEVVWSRYPDADIKLARLLWQSRWRWWQESPVTRESAKETVKTIRVRECRVNRRDRGD
jgi:hypothetical protein